MRSVAGGVGSKVPRLGPNEIGKKTKVAMSTQNMPMQEVILEKLAGSPRDKGSGREGAEGQGERSLA
jgi:hypothetical protein